MEKKLFEESSKIFDRKKQKKKQTITKDLKNILVKREISIYINLKKKIY